MTWSVALTTAMGADEAEFTRRADAILHTPDQLRNDQLGGTPEELRDRLGQWAGLGVQRVYLQVLDLADLDHIAELGAELVQRAGVTGQRRNHGGVASSRPSSGAREPRNLTVSSSARRSRLPLSDSDSSSLESCPETPWGGPTAPSAHAAWDFGAEEGPQPDPTPHPCLGVVSLVRSRGAGVDAEADRGAPQAQSGQRPPQRVEVADRVTGEEAQKAIDAALAEVPGTADHAHKTADGD